MAAMILPVIMKIKTSCSAFIFAVLGMCKSDTSSAAVVLAALYFALSAVACGCVWLAWSSFSLL
jgi:hypothetical protein